ncbi:hypothetical protein DPEC_G00244460 [Dallia pectoralis]|uniref:Uncharacterized protein n=1 Tax=Dallia pectoralis TaxID=75939 RepID=A0ACC2FVQ5_DALPE|nr:hypothetical protein DPEC_G00244460 [Dallia pectoralis]
MNKAKDIVDQMDIVDQILSDGCVPEDSSLGGVRESAAVPPGTAACSSFRWAVLACPPAYTDFCLLAPRAMISRHRQRFISIISIMVLSPHDHGMEAIIWGEEGTMWIRGCWPRVLGSL